MLLLWLKKKEKQNRMTFSSVICFVLLCLVADSTSCHVLGFNLCTSSLWVHFLITGHRILWATSTASLDLTNRLRAPLSKLDLELDELATEAQLPWVHQLFNYVSSLGLLPPPLLWSFCFKVLSSWVIFSITLFCAWAPCFKCYQVKWTHIIFYLFL